MRCSFQEDDFTKLRSHVVNSYVDSVRVVELVKGQLAVGMRVAYLLYLSVLGIPMSLHLPFA